MPSPALALPATDQPRCSSYRSHRIGPVGHVLAAGGLIKSEQRCEVCGTAFFLVRKAFT